MFSCLKRRIAVFAGLILAVGFMIGRVGGVAAEIPPLDAEPGTRSPADELSEREQEKYYEKLMRIEQGLLRELGNGSASTAQAPAKPEKIKVKISAPKKVAPRAVAVEAENLEITSPKPPSIGKTGSSCDALAEELSEGLIGIQETLRETIIASNNNLSKKIQKTQQDSIAEVVVELKDATALLGSMSRSLNKMTQRIDEENPRVALALPKPEAAQAEAKPQSDFGKLQPQNRILPRNDESAAPRFSLNTQQTYPPSIGALPIATVSAERAPVLIGPGQNEIVLTTLRRGTQVPVERIRGSWYRILTPSGGKVWIHSSYVQFG